MARDPLGVTLDDDEPTDVQAEEPRDGEADRTEGASPQASPAHQTPGAGGGDDVGRAASASPRASPTHQHATDDYDDRA